MFFAQVGLVGLVLLWFNRDNHVLQFQTLGWITITIWIVMSVGVWEQRNFYSNDQRLHAEVVDRYLAGTLNLDLDWWLGLSRAPYTVPAACLAAIGLHPLLALKTISLLSLLATSSMLSRYLKSMTNTAVVVSTYLTATGLIGVFFAALALRETMMMSLVLLFFASRSSAAKGSALLGLGLLRPHLAAAVLIGSLVGLALHKLRRDSTATPLTNFAYLGTAPILGYYVYSFGLQFQLRVDGIFGHTWGISPVLRIASNFVGLQFLTVRESTVEFSTTSLLLLRLLLSETIIIPLLFTTVVMLTRRHSLLMQSVMWSFGIYVGIVTNTDFNSFRQNIPFMPVMGLVILLAWKEHRESRRSAQTPPLTLRRET
jgi:hypothetical protein